MASSFQVTKDRFDIGQYDTPYKVNDLVWRLKE